MCCMNECVCFVCTWGSAMENAGLGSMPLCTAALLLCPWCTLAKGGHDTAAKYHLKENKCKACMKTWCCPVCYKLQVQNEIMVREKLSFGCAFLEHDEEVNLSRATSGGPNVQQMSRA